MEHSTHATDHREFEDLLAAAALGALTPEEHAALKRHLRGCAACRAAFGRLLSAADALPLAVEERAPSAGLRERLRAQVEPDARQYQASHPSEVTAASPAPSQPTSAGRGGTPVRRLRPAWLAAAAAVLILGIISGMVIDRFLLDREDDAESSTIALQYPTGMNIDDATLTWEPGDNLLRFSASGMPTPPEGHVYQVWLFEGETAIPSGVVDSSTGDYATVIQPDRYSTFAITVEPGPLGSEQATSDPVVVASLALDSET